MSDRPGPEPAIARPRLRLQRSEFADGCSYRNERGSKSQAVFSELVGVNAPQRPVASTATPNSGSQEKAPISGITDPATTGPPAVYGVRKIFPVKGSSTSVELGKARTSTKPWVGAYGLVTNPGLFGTATP